MGKGYALGSTASFPDSEVGFSFDEKAETHDLVAVACKTEGPEGAGDADVRADGLIDAEGLFTRAFRSSSSLADGRSDGCGEAWR